MMSGTYEYHFLQKLYEPAYHSSYPVPCLSGMEMEPPDPGSPTNPYWTCRVWNNILFLILCGFWELFVTTSYLILPCLTESNCTILADCRSLVIFVISRELKCQSWDMPSHLEYPNIAKEEALYFYICYG